MILVDTTVWIDFFNDKKSVQTAALVQSVEDGEDLCLCGIVLAEVLQGIKSDKEFDMIREILEDLIYLPVDKDTYILAAKIYRGCRKKGITIRKPMDCIIAAACIGHSVFILHNDRDFDNIGRYFPLASWTG